MQNISQRSKNSNRCSVQWLLRGDHKTESWGLVGNLSRGVTPLTLVPKLFIREAAVFHALACGSLTPSLTLFNDKNKQENKTTPPPPKTNPLWLCNESVWLYDLCPASATQWCHSLLPWEAKESNHCAWGHAHTHVDVLRRGVVWQQSHVKWQFAA